MRHTSEGELHAYLDGALELFGNEEALRIREHLESCAGCAARLEEEAALRAGASAILAQATPGDVSLPPLEELRRRAHSGKAEGRPSGPAVPRRVAWAWAATVVLALGVGWGVGGWRLRTSAPAEGGVVSSEAAFAPPAIEPAAPAGAGAAGDDPRAADDVGSGAGVVGGTRVADGTPAAEADASASAFEKVVEQEEVAVAAAPAPPAEPARFLDEATDRAAPAARAAVERDVAGAAAAQARVGQDAPPAAEPGIEGRLALDAVVVTGNFADADSLARESFHARVAPPEPLQRQETRSQPAPRGSEPPPAGPPAAVSGRDRRDTPAGAGEAAPSPAASLAIPGLEVAGVTLAHTAGLPTVRVLQRRSDGVPVELRFVGVQPEEAGANVRFRTAEPSGQVEQAPAAAGAARAEAAAAARPADEAVGRLMAEPLPSGWSQVALPFRGGWVVVRGPLPEAELARLAQGIR